VQEVRYVHPKGVSDEQEVAELHLAPSLHALDGRPVEAGGVGERFLGHVLVQSPHPYAVADSPARVDDP